MTTFTRASRARLLEALQQIDMGSVAASMFVTLTVPSQDACTFNAMKGHLAAWRKRMNRRWSGVGWFGFWKIEAHESGLPHLHLLIFWIGGAPSVEDFREWQDVAWADVVQSVNPHHVKRGCRVELMRSQNGVAFYCAEYCGKLSKHPYPDDFAGRCWGRLNGRHFAVRIVDRPLSSKVGKQVRRTLRRLQERKRARFMVRTLMDESGRMQWVPVRAGESMDISGGRVSAEERAREFQVFGIPVRLERRRCTRKHRLKIWAEFEEEFNGQRRVRSGVDFVGEEVTDYAFAVTYVDSVVAIRLADHFEALERLDASGLLGIGNFVLDEIPF